MKSSIMILYCTNTSKLEYSDEKEIDMIFSTKSYYTSYISEIVDKSMNKKTCYANMQLVN